MFKFKFAVKRLTLPTETRLEWPTVANALFFIVLNCNYNVCFKFVSKSLYWSVCSINLQYQSAVPFCSISLQYHSAVSDCSISLQFALTYLIRHNRSRKKRFGFKFISLFEFRSWHLWKLFDSSEDIGNSEHGIAPCPFLIIIVEGSSVREASLSFSNCHLLGVLDKARKYEYKYTLWAHWPKYTLSSTFRTNIYFMFFENGYQLSWPFFPNCLKFR